MKWWWERETKCHLVINMWLAKQRVRCVLRLKACLRATKYVYKRRSQCKMEKEQWEWGDGRQRKKWQRRKSSWHAWSMDPSVTSLIKTSAFIRRIALQYLYHEYFRVPSRSPDMERCLSAEKTESQLSLSTPDTRRKIVKVLHHTFFFHGKTLKS